jgi:hypothetical protein
LAKDSSVSVPPEDADDSPDEEDSAGDDGTGRDAVVDGGIVEDGGGPDISDTRLLGTLALRERDWRLYAWLIGGRGARACGRRRGGAVVLCGGG